MRLYDTPMAPNPRRVRWFMAEKGIDDLEIVTLNVMKGEHRAPEYLDRAGVANVPGLELDDGSIVTESVAICRYLESRYPLPNLFVTMLQQLGLETDRFATSTGTMRGLEV